MIIALTLLFVISGCSRPEEKVVVYTSVDRNYSEAIFESFEAETGIVVEAVYDVEAVKTTGLVQRLFVEKDRPVADVFWNGEVVQTIQLHRQGVLEGYETFGGRIRVIIANESIATKNSFSDAISSFPIASESYAVGIAKPLFGTTATHVAAYYAYLGETEADILFEKVKNSSVVIADGNGAVRDMVVSGQLDYGLTDTDDALGALRKGAQLTLVFPDQIEGPGTLVIPNSVGKIENSSNPDNGAIFINYLQGQIALEQMTASGWLQAMDTDGRQLVPELIPFLTYEDGLRVMEVDWELVADVYSNSSDKMKQLFLD